MSRRKFLRLASSGVLAAACAPKLMRAGAPALLAGRNPRDIRIEEVTFGYEDFLYRTPIKFGGTVLDRVTLLNVDCVVRTAGGHTAKGFGSMPLGNVWAVPVARP